MLWIKKEEETKGSIYLQQVQLSITGSTVHSENIWGILNWINTPKLSNHCINSAVYHMKFEMVRLLLSTFHTLLCLVSEQSVLGRGTKH